MKFHIANILLKYITYLSPVAKCFPKYIEHEFMEKAKEKSVFLNCDLIDASENSSQGMIEILQRVHQLAVPHVRDNPDKTLLEKVVFGGDVLTNERHSRFNFNDLNKKKSKKNIVYYIFFTLFFI